MRIHQLRSFILVVFCLILLISGCNNPSEKQNSTNEEESADPQTEQEEASAPVIKAGGTITIGVLQLPNWDPLKWDQSTASFSPAERLVYRGLFTYSPDQRLVGDLVKDYRIDKKDDTTTLTFTLKEDLKWHDGTPITIEDIRFTLETYLNPFYYGAWKQQLSYIEGTSSYRSGKKETISGIGENDQGEIVLTLSNPTSSFFHALTAPILPAHQLKGKNPEEIAALAKEGKMVGNGPFAFSKKDEQSITLKRSAAHDQGGPLLDEIRFALYSDEGVQQEDENPYDIVPLIPGEEKDAKNGSVLEVPQNLYYYLGFNHKDEQLSRKEVRTAIAKALQPEQMVKEALYGYGVPVHSILTSASWAFEPDQNADTNNLEEAKNAMASLGYSADKPFKATFHYPDQPVFEQVAEIIANQLKEAYFQIEKKPLAKDEYYPYLFSGKETQLFLHAWPFEKDFGNWWKIFGGYHTVDELGLNIYRYSNTELDAILKDLYANAPSIEQKDQIQKAVRILQTDVAIVPLFTPVQRYAVREGVHEAAINGEGWLIEPEKWWIEQ